MTPLYTQEEFDRANSKQPLPLRCEICNKQFLRRKYSIQRGINELEKHPTRNKYCSNKCAGIDQQDRLSVICFHCGKEVFRKRSHVGKSISGTNFCSLICKLRWSHIHHKMGRKQNRVNINCRRCGKEKRIQMSKFKGSPNHYCSVKCHLKWCAEHKTKAHSVSKLEKWLAEQLVKLFPTIEFHFNRRDAIKSELDIYIPQFKLAFEVNGILHYKPIYKQRTLENIQANDRKKIQACFDNGIELHTIDTSSLNIFHKNKSDEFLKIIVDIINSKLASNK